MSRLISETRPVARKAHTCAPCRTTIQPGDIYHRQVSVEDLGFSTWKACEPCADIVNEVFVWSYYPDEGVNAEDYLEWARERVGMPEADAYLQRAGKTS